MRKPGRTATTAAALMIGLALVVFVTVFAAGLKASVRRDDRRELPRRDRAPEQRRLLADPARGGQAGWRDRRCRHRVVDHLRHGRAAEWRPERAHRRGSTRPRSARCWRSRSRAATRRCSADWDRATRSWTRTSLATRGSRWATRCGCARRSSKRPTFRVVGEVEGELDLLGKAIVDESATRQFGRLQPSLALARLGAGRVRSRCRTRWRPR